MYYLKRQSLPCLEIWFRHHLLQCRIKNKENPDDLYPKIPKLLGKYLEKVEIRKRRVPDQRFFDAFEVSVYMLLIAMQNVKAF